jgi:hypothetical protein
MFCIQRKLSKAYKRTGKPWAPLEPSSPGKPGNPGSPIGPIGPIEPRTPGRPYRKKTPQSANLYYYKASKVCIMEMMTVQLVPGLYLTAVIANCPEQHTLVPINWLVSLCVTYWRSLSPCRSFVAVNSWESLRTLKSSRSL